MEWRENDIDSRWIFIGSSSAPEAEELGRLLSDEGYQIDLACRPFQAIRKLMMTGFKAAILLLQPDDRSWVEFVPVFKELFPHLPIIVIADSASLESERLLRQGRIFYYLLKPIDPLEIKSVLSDASKKTNGWGK